MVRPLSFRAVLRTREVETRMALGASRHAVTALIVGRGPRLTINAPRLALSRGDPARLTWIAEPAVARLAGVLEQ